MRIRSTKPEFWRSERIASLSWEDRLVFKGLESYVDDNGVGKDDIALIVGEVFPRDMLANPRETVARVSEGISRLHQAGLLWRYEAAGTRLLYVSFWESAQRIDKPGKGRFPRPDGTMGYGDSQIRESVASLPETVAPGTGEQGNRGTEEQGKRDLAAQAQPPKNRATRITSDWMPDRPVIEAMKTERPDVDFDAEHRRFIDYWLGKSGRDATKVDWNATWRNWIRNARAPSTAPNGRAHKMRTLAELAQETAAEENRIIPKELPA